MLSDLDNAVRPRIRDIGCGVGLRRLGCDWSRDRPKHPGFGSVFDGALGPSAQRWERIETRAVSVVPDNIEAPRSMEFCIGDPERDGTRRPRPDVFVAIAKAPAFRTRATQPEFHEVELDRRTVGVRNLDALVALHDKVNNFIAITHCYSLSNSLRRQDHFGYVTFT